MSKGIKMHAAVDAQNTLLTVAALQTMSDANQAIPLLRCDQAACREPVRFVGAYQKAAPAGGDPIHVSAYIGLINGGHQAGCKYDAAGALKTIVAAQSDRNFLGQLDTGKHELRLLVLFNSLAPTPKNAGAQPATTSPAAGTKPPIQYVASGAVLDSYLRTTQDLLELRSRCEDDEFLSTHLALTLGDKRIKWCDFFFEHDRFDAAYQRIASTGATFPFALVGTVGNHGNFGDTTFLNCRSSYVPTQVPGTFDAFGATVAHKDGTWLRGFAPGTKVLMFGLWTLGKTKTSTMEDPNDPTKLITYINHSLMLKPGRKPQVIAIP